MDTDTGKAAFIMRLSIENYVIRKHFGDEQAIAMLAEAGFDAMDFSFYWMPKEENFLDRDDYLDHARAVRIWADKAGIAITQGHAPFDLNILYDSKEKQAYDYEQIRRAIACAGAMGIEQIIVHNLITANAADFEDVNLKFFRSLEPDAAKAGVRIAVENLWGVDDGKIVGGRLSTPATLSAFLDKLDPAHFCGCIDLGHAAIVGEDPAQFIRNLGVPKLAALHVQDTDLMHDTHTLPYLGKHDWDAITSALAETGYDGDLTFEIFAFLGALPKETLGEALKLAHSVGRKLINGIEKKR